MIKRVLVIVCLAFLSSISKVSAQANPEDIAMVSDAYQDSFYESLLQKGIENYDKAIVALEKCLKLQPNDATIHFELGKNYLALKDYKNAQISFEKATLLNPSNKWFLLGIYDVSYQTKNYPLAINTIQKIIVFDEDYKDDLISLYMITNNYDEALKLINEMNDKYGKTDQRDVYKKEILSQGKYQNAEVEALLTRIKKDPKEEESYLALIYLYNEKGNSDKALEITKQLEKEIPSSEWAQVSLFKTYLEQNNAQKAIEAMNLSLASSKIDSKIKHRILNDFLIYVDKNPQYTPDLERAISYFDNDKTVNVSREIGKYYHSKKQFDKAGLYYEKALKKGTEVDIETNLLVLEVYSELKQFEKMDKISAEMIEIFPSQPQFYYYSGLANNQLKQFKKAKDVLEMGLDYVVDDVALEINFNMQLGESYNALGDMKKKEDCFLKANQLLSKQKK